MPEIFVPGLDAKLDHLDEKHCATVFVMGSGMGVTQGARHMRGLVNAPTLGLINRRHVTIDKLDAAHRDILDAYNQFELPRCWGSGKTAAFDGSLFELSEQNLLADFHFRYRLKGAVAFQVVSDLYIALFMHFIPPGVWEAVYIIEALMKNRSKIQPDTVFADTQGLRVTEACRLRLDQVDTESRVLHVARLKNGLSTTQPLRGDELRAIAAWLKERARMKPPGKSFFVSEQRKPLHRSTVNLALQKYSAAASLPLLAHPHMLRHACGFALADQGADTRLIQDYLGHRNIQHTVRYTATNPARFEKLWR